MSIKRKVTILFMLSLILMLTLGIWLKRVNEDKNSQILISKYLNSSKEILPLIFNSNIKLLDIKLIELNLKRVKELDAKALFKKSLGVGELSILKQNKKLILKINYLDENYYFEDRDQEIYEQEELITTLFLLFIIALLIFIYLSILKIISPIKRLSINMEKFAKGNFDIKMQESGADEVAVASRSFNKMAQELKSSFQDRENLLRYFGHEIRTPLAKAQYAYENQDLETIKKNLTEIERFVNGVLNLHLITSKNLNRENFLAHTLVAESLNRCKVIDENDIKVDIKNDFSINGDLYYLSIALKNLIDNGLKYSSKPPVKIVVNSNKIEVISRGKELDKSFEHYLKPFNKKSKNGFGLGLSLTELILKKHNFNLKYKYIDKKNIFTIGSRSTPLS